MSKKVSILVTTLIGVVATAAEAIVAFIGPDKAAAIIAAIGVVEVAAIDVVNIFTAKETKKVEGK